MLVRFRDPTDLRSVEGVNPFNIAERFGSGAKLIRATLEVVPAGIWPLSLFGITGEPITRGIEGKLPWWNGPFPWEKPMGNGVFKDTRTDPLKLNKADFKSG